MARIFVSHSTRDRAFVEDSLIPLLVENQIDHWYAPEDIATADEWAERIVQGLRECDWFLVVLSPEAVESEWVKNEVHWAMQNRPSRVIPLMLKDCDPTELHLKLFRIQFVDFRSRDPDRSSLLELFRDSGGRGTTPGFGDIEPDRFRMSDGAPDRANRIDWGDAPHVSCLYERDAEIATLKSWIAEERSQLVGLIGLGGIGKSALAVKVAEDLAGEFDCVVWRSLRNALPADDLLGDLIGFISGQEEVGLGDGLARKLPFLLNQLRQHRCLVILDNAETVLPAVREDVMQPEGSEEYQMLLHKLGESRHNSCIVVTSRVKPDAFNVLDGAHSKVHSLRLSGLGKTGGTRILADKKLDSSAETLEMLVDRYSGNPLAMKLVGELVREVFGGNVERFLEEGDFLVGDVKILLDQHFDHLSPIENELMYWLAIEREPIELRELRQSILRTVSFGEIVEAIRRLNHLCLVEEGSGGFTLQNVVLEYVTDKIVDRIVVGEYLADRLASRISDEIARESISLFRSHALMKSTSKAYVRESQVRLILRPILDRLLSSMPTQELEQKIKGILDSLRRTGEQQADQSYGGGNAFNLLVLLGSDLTGFDFSNLCVWQGFFRGVEVRNVDFSGSDLAGCVFTDTFGSTTSVAIDPGGKLVAAATSNEIRILRKSDWQHLKTCHVEQDWVREIAFSPDGSLLASANEDRTVQVWDTDTGECLHRLGGHSGRVFTVAFSKNNRLASGSDDDSIRIWDPESGELLRTFEIGRGWVLGLDFHLEIPNRLAAAVQKGIVVIDIESDAAPLFLESPADHFTSVAFVDKERLAAAGGRGDIYLWDSSAEGFDLRPSTTFTGHNGEICSLRYNTHFGLLASSSDDRVIRLWDVTNGRCVNALQGHSNRVWSVGFSPEGKQLISGGEDQSVRVWDTRSGNCLNTLLGYSIPLWSLSISPDQTILVTGCEDSIARIWDLSEQRCIASLIGHRNTVWATAQSHDNRLIATGSGDRSIRVWDAKTLRCLRVLEGHQGWVRAVAFSQARNLLASGSEDQTVRIWNAESGHCLHTLRGHGHRVLTVAFSPDGRILASAGGDRSIQIWDVESGELQFTLDEHSDQVRSLAFSVDGDILASGSTDRRICLWNTRSGEKIKCFEAHKGQVLSLSFDKDGTLISGGGDRVVKQWQAGSFGCLREMPGHRDQIRGVGMIGENRIASASEDGTVMIWDQGEWTATLESERPYEGMNITGITGITEACRETLLSLGAIETGTFETHPE